jgi:hypothetical protein
MAAPRRTAGAAPGAAVGYRLAAVPDLPRTARDPESGVGRLRAGSRRSRPRNHARKRGPRPRERPAPDVGYRLAAVPDLRESPSTLNRCRSAARRQPTFPTRNHARKRGPRPRERPAPDVGYRLTAVPDLPRTARDPESGVGRLRAGSRHSRPGTTPEAEPQARAAASAAVGYRLTAVPDLRESPSTLNRCRSAARRQPTGWSLAAAGA